LFGAHSKQTSMDVCLCRRLQIAVLINFLSNYVGHAPPRLPRHLTPAHAYTVAIDDQRETLSNDPNDLNLWLSRPGSGGVSFFGGTNSPHPAVRLTSKRTSSHLYNLDVSSSWHNRGCKRLSVKRGFQPPQRTQRNDECTQAPAKRNRDVLFAAELKFLSFKN